MHSSAVAFAACGESAAHQVRRLTMAKFWGCRKLTNTEISIIASRAAEGGIGIHRERGDEALCSACVFDYLRGKSWEKAACVRICRGKGLYVKATPDDVAKMPLQEADHG